MEYVDQLLTYFLFSVSIITYTIFFFDFKNFKPKAWIHSIYYVLAYIILFLCLPLLTYYEELVMKTDLINYTFLYTVLVLFILLENKSDVRKKLFFIISGMSLRIAVSRIGVFIITVSHVTNTYLNQLISLSTLLVLYIPIYFFGARRMAKNRNFVPTTGQVVFFCLISFALSYGSFLERYVMDEPAAYAYYVCIEVVPFFLLIFYQYYVFASSQKALEANYREMLMYDRIEQYESLKDVIGAMNIKSHDLKHQIKSYRENNMVDGSVLDDLERTISNYDASVNTGYGPLDTILTAKSYLCLKQEIKLHVYVDYKYFMMFSIVELNDLLGNAIDNAIEYLSGSSVTDKTITIKTRESRNFVKIVIENSCLESPRFDDGGFPITTKDDLSSHGFGSKSIAHIADEHHGMASFSWKEGVYEVCLVFPTKELGKAANCELKSTN